MENKTGSIVVYKDGSHHYFADGQHGEFLNDPDFLVVLKLDELVDYLELNKSK